MSGYGIVGYGRIGRRVAERLAGAKDAPPLAAVLTRSTGLDAFIATKPDIAIECASREWLAEHGTTLLAAGIDLVPLSLTALADEKVERCLMDAAARGPGRLEITPGAIGSLDLLAIAREEGLERVVYRQLNLVGGPCFETVAARPPQHEVGCEHAPQKSAYAGRRACPSHLRRPRDRGPAG